MTTFAFRVAPQKEFLARDVLDRMGFNAFFPIETRYRRSNGRRKATERQYPLLVGYILMSFEGGCIPWHHLSMLRFLKGVVGVAGVPAPISQSALERMRVSAPHETSVNTRKSFRKGDTVKTTGAFDGVTMHVEEVRGDKARVMLGLLGAVREATVKLQRLEAA